MVAAKHWPNNLCPASISFHPNIPSASGGVSMGGDEQITFSSAGRWKASISLYSHFRRDITKLLVARSMLAFLKGRTNRIYIGPYDNGKSPGALGLGSASNVITDIPHSDETLFSDETGYSQGLTSSVILNSAFMGDLILDITMPDFSPQPGQWFGLGLSELYLIDSVEALGGNNYRLTFWPTLRADHVAGEDVNFDTPTCEMRQASDDGFGVTIDKIMVSHGQLELVEAI